jgi:hypothetical protein
MPSWRKKPSVVIPDKNPQWLLVKYYCRDVHPPNSNRQEPTEGLPTFHPLILRTEQSALLLIEQLGLLLPCSPL